MRQTQMWIVLIVAICITMIGGISRAEDKMQDVVAMNVAAREQLTTLPGVNESIARSIVEGQPYQSVRELKDIPGIDYEQMLDLFIAGKVRLKMNLKTAKDDELLKLPGIDKHIVQQIIDNKHVYTPYNLEKRLLILKDDDGNILGEERFQQLAPFIEAPLVINVASPEDLVKLPGIDEEMAQRIFENRPYTQKADLLALEGMEKETLADLSGQIALKLLLRDVPLEVLTALPLDIPEEIAKQIAGKTCPRLDGIQGISPELLAKLQQLTMVDHNCKGWQPRKIFLNRETPPDEGE